MSSPALAIPLFDKEIVSKKFIFLFLHNKERPCLDTIPYGNCSKGRPFPERYQKGIIPCFRNIELCPHQ
jgi:hypothetical protein